MTTDRHSLVPPHPLRPRHVVVMVGIGLAMVAFVLLLWQIFDVLLLVFAGGLLALALSGVADWVSGRTGLAAGWSLAVVLILALSAAAAVAWLLAPRIGEQLDLLVEQLPRSRARLEEQLSQFGWGRWLMNRGTEASAFLPEGSNVLARATGAVSSTLGMAGNIVIALFVGLYLAAEPRVYHDGLLRLIPLAGRRRTRELLSSLAVTLRRWLAGRAILMLVNGALTAAGLWLLDVPLALTLALAAGLLNFIPNIGPFLAAVPAVGVALLESPSQALYVLLLYLVLQMADGYVFTPLIDRQTVNVPPALTITGQVIMGMWFGVLGLALASPLVAAVTVVVRMLYVEDVLGDRVSARSRPAAEQ